eukprot:3494909-Prymnesium_polylepis.2
MRVVTTRRSRRVRGARGCGPIFDRSGDGADQPEHARVGSGPARQSRPRASVRLDPTSSQLRRVPRSELIRSSRTPTLDCLLPRPPSRCSCKGCTSVLLRRVVTGRDGVPQRIVTGRDGSDCDGSRRE